MDARATARWVVAAAGRDRELQALAEAWQQARAAGAPRFCKLHGPAGIGKSHLLHVLERRLASEGATLLSIRAERGRVEAFGLARDLARSLLDLLSRIGGCSRFELASLSARLAPLLDDVAGGEAGRPSGDLRLELADGLAELVRRVLPTEPVLLLDDLDAADRGSLELLQYLSALLLAPGMDHGCLVVFSYRDGDLPAALRNLIDGVPGLQLPLAPLDLEGIRSFLSSPEVAERLWEATSGNPSRLEAVLETAPIDFGKRRLARLGPEARRILLAVAVVGRRAPASLIQAAARVPDAGTHLEKLVVEGFLEVQVDRFGPGYTFSRTADREAILESATEEERAAYHLAVAEGLVERGGGLEEIARHYLAGDPKGQGARWARKAARHLASRSAFDAAIEFYLAALQGPDDRRELHLGLAETYEAVGDMIAALRHVGLSRKSATAEERRSARSEAARLCIRIGKLAQAERLCRIVLGDRNRFDPTDLPAARAWVDLAEIAFLRSDFDRAISLCKEGIERAADLPRERIALRNTLGKSLLLRGNHLEAAGLFRTNAEEARQAGLSREAMFARINEGVAYHRHGDRERAIQLYREGLAAGEDRSVAAMALGNLGVLYHEAGEFQEALEHYASALAACTLVRRREGLALQGINRARLLHLLGDLDGAEAGVLQARTEAERLGNAYLVTQADLVRAEIALGRNEPLAARETIEQVRSRFVSLGSGPRYIFESELVLVRTLLELGSLAAAQELVEELGERVGSIGAPELEVEWALRAAEVHLATGEASRALALLEEARTALLARPAHADQLDLEAPWKLYALLARCHEALGEQAVAEAHRVRSRSLFDELLRRVPAAYRDRFLARIDRVRLLAEPSREIGATREGLRRRLESPVVPGAVLVGSSKAMRQLQRRIGPVGRSLAPVLIRGESGTGRKSLAHEIHRASPRANAPLVKVICSLPPEQLDLELFGAPGRRGRIEQAHGGTLFLQEVANLSPAAQTALLRVIEEKVLEPPGGGPAVPVDVRIVAATVANLEELVEAGRFRAELYYRLKGMVLELPPLRERREDVQVLAEHFLARYREQRGEGPVRFSAEALALLEAWNWPGNVRELEMVVGAVSVFAEGEVVGMDAFELQSDFLRAVRGSNAPRQQGSAEPTAVSDSASIDFYALAKARGLGVRELQHELEQQMISRALIESKGNISEAARLLQMKRSRLSQIVNAEPRLLALARGAGV